MRSAAARYLLGLSLRRGWASHLRVLLALAIGTFTLGLAGVLGFGLERSIRQYIQKVYPENRVILEPKALSVIWLQVEAARITPDTVESIEEMDGVKRVSPEATIRFPISAEANLLGNLYRSDITITGVEDWLLGGSAPEAFSYDIESGGEVPAVLASYFLDLYNMALAESNNLPKLSPGAAIGRHFRIYLGESSLRPGKRYGPDGSSTYVDCRIRGLTRNADLLGLIIPLKAVEDFNRWYGIEEREYRRLHVELETVEALEALEAKAATLNLTLRDTTGAWRKIVLYARILGWGITLFGVGVFLLALAYLLSTLSWNLARREKERAIFRAVGASSREIVRLFSLETGLVGAAGILLGLGFSALVGLGLNHLYQGWRGERTFLPERLTDFSGLWLLLAGLVCWIALLALAWRRIAREEKASLSYHLATRGN